MPRTCRQRHTLSVGATRVIRVDFTSQLEEGASISTPTAVEQVTSDLTISGVATNTGTYTDDSSGATVAIGKSVLFAVSGGSAGQTYVVLVTAVSDSSPEETIPWYVEISWE